MIGARPRPVLREAVGPIPTARRGSRGSRPGKRAGDDDAGDRAQRTQDGSPHRRMDRVTRRHSCQQSSTAANIGRIARWGAHYHEATCRQAGRVPADGLRLDTHELRSTHIRGSDLCDLGLCDGNLLVYGACCVARRALTYGDWLPLDTPAGSSAAGGARSVVAPVAPVAPAAALSCACDALGV
jgi:hypothetical protein